MQPAFLPYGVQDIDDSDIAAVVSALKSEMLTTGPRVTSFEQAFAKAVGAQHAIAFCNATAALHIAALAGGVGQQDVCLAPTMSFLASANGMRFTGADIIFIDCDGDSGLVTPETFQRAIDSAQRPPRMAVIVHLNGHICDLPAISAIAKKHGIILVEDACHAVGGRYRDESGAWTAVGSCSHSAMTCFSFHPVKTITMGEGGVVTTNDPVLAQKLKALRSHGMTRDAAEITNADLAFDEAGALNPWYYEMPALGYNYRATDMQCALGESQLARLGKFAARREAIRQRYDDLFAAMDIPAAPIAQTPGTDPVLHLYALQIPFGQNGVPTRSALMHALKARGIGTQVHYIPIHRQPYYAALGAQHCPGADAYYAKALSIPFYPSLSDADVDRVAAAFAELLPGGAAPA